MVNIPSLVSQHPQSLNSRVQGLANALGLLAGARDTHTGQGTTFRWPLLSQGMPDCVLELWVGHARCSSKVQGQLAVATLNSGADGNMLRQVCLLSPDHEKANRSQALTLARQRLAGWLDTLTAEAAAHGSLASLGRLRT